MYFTNFLTLSQKRKQKEERGVRERVREPLCALHTHGKAQKCNAQKKQTKNNNT
jgi:hypothetical protein